MKCLLNRMSLTDSTSILLYRTKISANWSIRFERSLVIVHYSVLEFFIYRYTVGDVIGFLLYFGSTLTLSLLLACGRWGPLRRWHMKNSSNLQHIPFQALCTCVRLASLSSVTTSGMQGSYLATQQQQAYWLLVTLLLLRWSISMSGMSHGSAGWKRWNFLMMGGGGGRVFF